MKQGGPEVRRQGDRPVEPSLGLPVVTCARCRVGLHSKPRDIVRVKTGVANPFCALFRRGNCVIHQSLHRELIGERMPGKRRARIQHCRALQGEDRAGTVTEAGAGHSVFECNAPRLW